MVFRSPDHKASSEVETGGYAVASSSTDDVVVMQKEHITSSGLHTIVYAKKYQSPVETTGYIIVYEQGILHVMSEEGIYEVDSDFIKSNNCFFPNKDFAENEQDNESEQDGVDEESERANSVGRRFRDWKRTRTREQHGKLKGHPIE